ncbi:MAG TPA: tetratricopeptide repeat protein [Chthoniobacterales bacterium]|nr:tetratricopeptide repeat protein [Chthoniobacterales bacterium]
MRAQLVLRFAICVGLVAITWAVFGQTVHHGFVNFDDPIYVSENDHVYAGLNWAGVAWAFTHIHSHNWHPLTTMSHMLDCQMFGVKPGAHHFVNFLLHSANVVLLFVLLAQMTGRLWSSAFVAAIFAIHPLHVESVAWVSERKDVLSGLFFMLTLLAYFRYAQKRTVGRYVTMSILFACGLMSKPMLVTLPIILLLLDYWPFERFSGLSAARILVEKIPLGILSIASAAATLVVQNEGVGLVRLEVLPLSWRITNALAAYLVYIWQMIWPANLALAYHHPGELPVWQVAGAAALLMAVTLGVFALRKRSPYLIVGWSWYLIMLLPVIGLVQVGGQAHADRYTYLPQIGLYIAATWGVVGFVRSWRYHRPVLGVAATIIIGALAFRAADQAWYWHDSERLWRHTLAVTTENDVAHLGLGQLLMDQKRPDDAIAEYEAAAKIGPNPDVETTLANLLLEQGRIEEAISYYRHVVQLQPSSALAHYNLAVGLHRDRQLPEAILHYKAVLTIDPKYPDADHFLGQALLENGQADEAKIHLEKR